MNGLSPPPDLSGEANHGGDFIRTYKDWKGNNVFGLWGRLIFGPDVRYVFFTIFLIVAPVAVFCVFVARKLMDDFPHHLGISIMAVAVALTLCDLILLLLTSGRDPGIIPRNPEPEGYEEMIDLPRTKEVIINGTSVMIKYCRTCMLYRPPRCVHCSTCDNCVDRYDHHCPWIGQCVGLRNYRFFFMFIFFATLLCLYLHGFCWVYIRRIMDGEETTIWKAMTKTPPSIVLIIYTFLVFWFVGGLTVFHLYLISTNQSTNVFFKYRYPKNPYNKGVLKNFMEAFCTSIPPSKTNFRAKIPREPAISPNTVTGGFLSSNEGITVGDFEMGRKPPWDEALGEISDKEEVGRDSVDKNSRLPDVSPGLKIVVRPGAMHQHS